MIEKMLHISVKNTSQPIHWHDPLEIVFVLEGEMDVVRNNKTFQIKAGEIIVINRDDVHSISSKSDDLLYAQIHMHMEHYNQYIPDIWTVLVYCSPEEDDAVKKNLKKEIKSNISNIIQLIETQIINIDAERKIIYYCIDILNSFKLAFQALTVSEGKKINEEQANRLWKIIDYIYDNHQRKLPLHEIAQIVYVSDDYLSKILKKQVGMGYEEFLAFIRSEMSIRSLLNTDKSISDISMEHGFSAPKYYNAAFQKNYECSPKEYREKNRDNFQLERHQEETILVYDEGIDRDHVLDLLKGFKLEPSNSTMSKNISIDFRKLEACGELVTDFGLSVVWKGEIRNFNLQRELSDVQIPYVQLDSNALAWWDHGALKILIINKNDITSSCQKEYILRFYGLDPNEKYIYCRARSPEVPSSIGKLANSGNIGKLNREIIDNMYNMTYEFGEVYSEDQFYMNIEMKGEQLTKVILQKIR